MSQCLRCNKPCIAVAVFCDECQLLLRNKEHIYQDVSEITTARHAVLSEEQPTSVSDGPLERLSIQHPERDVSSMLSPSAPSSMVEQAFHKLTDAARRIAAVEPEGKHRKPRASRLSPLHDISADIRRHSTPLPRTLKRGEHGDNRQQKDNQPDVWPWLQDVDDVDEKEESWAERSDPLVSRRFPNSLEAASIEAEDMRRAMAEKLAAGHLPRLYQRATRLRVAFAGLAIIAVVALAVDSFMASIAFLYHTPKASLVAAAPSLTLSSTSVTYGQTVTLTLSHFIPTTQVFLTHDIEVPLQTTTGSSFVLVDQNGAAEVQIGIESNWNTGFHNIDAEDLKSRETASATLQITAGPTRPAHLVLTPTLLDLGAAPQGANTVQPLELSNAGSGAITWTVSSNQPWLMVSPTEGKFSDRQTISVGGERANLKPGDYLGTITFSSNVGSPQTVQVQMTVRPVSTDMGPVLSIAPAVLAFTAVDNGAEPASQFLVINNPGSKPLSWSVASGTRSVSSQDPLSGSGVNWLTTDRTSGIVVPHATELVRVIAHSRNLLPGAYTSTLLFTAAGAINSPQSVEVSLTVQQRCSLMVSTGSMSFTAVAGQGNPGNQVLNVSATTSCPNNTDWQATSSAPSWLVVTPARGTWKGGIIPITVDVDTSSLTPGPTPIVGYISIATAQNTQTVMVQLTLQPPPPPSSPILAAAPLNLNFSTTQGQSRPAPQAVTITNTGGSALNWRTTVNLLASTWLASFPSGGSLAPGQVQHLTVAVGTNGLTPGTYVGQVVLFATDANNQPVAGSPQTITINLVVLPACALAQPSSSSLAFSATQGGSDPATQSVVLTVSGNCAWPLNWSATVTSAAPWLKISPSTSGSFDASGQSTSLVIAPSIAGLAPGTYTTQVSVVAIDAASRQAQGSPQLFTIALTVLQPCTLQLSTPHLTFSVVQGQTSSSQSVTLNEAGSCVRPVSWIATGDAGSSSWLVLNGSSGSDNGIGGLMDVSVNATNLTPGTYTGSLNISVTDNGGAIVQSSPQSITVTLTVTN